MAPTLGSSLTAWMSSGPPPMTTTATGIPFFLAAAATCVISCDCVPGSSSDVLQDRCLSD